LVPRKHWLVLRQAVVCSPQAHLLSLPVVAPCPTADIPRSQARSASPLPLRQGPNVYSTAGAFRARMKARRTHGYRQRSDHQVLPAMPAPARAEIPRTAANLRVVRFAPTPTWLATPLRVRAASPDSHQSTLASVARCGSAPRGQLRPSAARRGPIP